MNEDRRIKDRRASPAIGDFALQERGELLARIAELEAHAKRLGQGDAERYWEGRWREAERENSALKKLLERAHDRMDELKAQPSAGVTDEAEAFKTAWPSISANLPSHQREPYSAQDVERAERDAAREAWQARARLDSTPDAGSGVVLPERVPYETPGSEYFHGYNAGWAGSIDEVARLNPCRAQAVVDVRAMPHDMTGLALKYARHTAWALGPSQGLKYVPQNAEQAESFKPHTWVTQAIYSAFVDGMAYQAGTTNSRMRGYGIEQAAAPPAKKEPGDE